MRLILNVIWLILCGWWMAILYFLAGIIGFVLIITIPFGIAAWRIAGYVLWPFGRTIEPRRDFGAGALIGNVLWIILVGWWLAVGHLTGGIALCLTIIGIPLGLANFKMIPISLLPLGVEIVPTGQPYPGYSSRLPGRCGGVPPHASRASADRGAGRRRCRTGPPSDGRRGSSAI